MANFGAKRKALWVVRVAGQGCDRLAHTNHLLWVIKALKKKKKNEVRLFKKKKKKKKTNEIVERMCVCVCVCEREREVRTEPVSTAIV